MSVETFSPRDIGQANGIHHGPTASHSVYRSSCGMTSPFAHLGQGQTMCGCVGSVLDVSRELALAKTRDATLQYATCR